MALHADWSACPPAFFALSDDLSTALVFRTMAVGVGDLTGPGADEYVARNLILDALHGPLTNGTEDERRALYLAARNLKVNVSPESRDAWVARIVGGDLDAAATAARAARTEADGPDAPVERTEVRHLSYDERRDLRHALARHALVLVRATGDAARDDVTVEDLQDHLDDHALSRVARAVHEAAATALDEAREYALQDA